VSISRIAKLLRFLNPDNVGGILLGGEISFDFIFDFRAFFANGYEFEPDKSGVAGATDEVEGGVVEALASDSANEGRGGGVSYIEGPACIRR
jgi:hypothetical protein